MVIGEINHRTAHLMNILWMGGTFTFAIVLGVVTEDIVNHVVVSLLPARVYPLGFRSSS